MKKNQGLIILLLIVLFLYLKPSTYASPPPVVPIKYKLIQGGKLPELAPVPKSNKLLTNYRNAMEKYIDALEKSYVTSAQNIAYVQNSDATISNTSTVVRNFITQHNEYFKAKSTTDVCSWIYSLVAVGHDSVLLAFMINDPGMKPLVPFLGTDNKILSLVTDLNTSLGGKC